MLLALDIAGPIAVFHLLYQLHSLFRIYSSGVKPSIEEELGGMSLKLEPFLESRESSQLHWDTTHKLKML